MNKKKFPRCIYTGKIIDNSKQVIIVEYIEDYLKKQNKIIINKSDIYE